MLARWKLGGTNNWRAGEESLYIFQETKSGHCPSSAVVCTAQRGKPLYSF